MQAMPFGVDIELFKPDSSVSKDSVILYYKDRIPSDFELLTQKLKERNISYTLFNYKTGYKESDFISTLKKCKYCIFLGRHESQGFAVQEIMACNVPLFVWGVTSRRQEYPGSLIDKNIITPATTVPYWDDICGEHITDFKEFDTKFDIFLNKLQTYQPRKFICENLSMNACNIKWDNFIIGTILQEYNGINLNNVWCKHLLPNEKYQNILSGVNEYFYLKPHHCMKIENTIPYKSVLLNDFELYGSWTTDTNQKEHTIDNYKQLIKNFDVSKINKIVLYFDKKNNKLFVHDGLHRISIMLYKNIITNFIPKNMIQIISD